jgi:hypothetical protein
MERRPYNVEYFEGVNPMVIYEKAIKLEPPKTVAVKLS